MTIEGQGHSVALVQGHSDSILANFFSLETFRPTEAKYHVKPPLGKGTKIRLNGLGHMINKAAMPIYGKNI